MGKAEKPWTWEEIEALKPWERAMFQKAYGDRAKVAMIVAYGMARQHGRSVRIPCTDEPVKQWGYCPLERPSRAVQGDLRNCLGCVDRAPIVYARMVAKLGLLPEGM